MANGELTSATVGAAETEPTSEHGIFPCQVPLYELMLHSLVGLRDAYLPLWKVLLLTLLSIPTGAAIGVVAVLGVAWLVHWMHWREEIIYLTFFIPVMWSVIRLIARQREWLAHIDWVNPSTGNSRLRFYRLNLSLGRGIAINTLLIGILFGIHVQIIYQTVDHGGLEKVTSWFGAARLAGTNFLDAITLGLTHSLGVGLADRPHHNPLSAVCFGTLRIAYDAHVALFAFALWKRRVIVRLSHEYDRYLAISSPANLIAYIQTVCYTPQRWSKYFHDEFVVFCHVERCLTTDYGTCRALRVMFPELRMPDRVYAMLLDGTRQSVFRFSAR